MRFLFWNIGKQSLLAELKEIVKHKDVDILALAEFQEVPNTLLKQFASEKLNFYAIPQIGCKRITIFSKFSPAHFETGPETEYYTIKKLSVSPRDKLIIAFVHFPSKLYLSNDDQMDESRLFKTELEEAERRFQNTNTLIVGDFNMNPFERGMVAASGIHALPCALTTKRLFREVKGRAYTMFYNPMWNLFGDQDHKPGTYYYSHADHLVYFWNILDQVIMRPALIERFQLDSLEIVTQGGQLSLIDDNYKPCRSDHLPIFFELTNISEVV